MKFENISAYILNEFIPMNIGLTSDKLRDEILSKVEIPGLANVNDELLFRSLCHKSFVHENKKLVTLNNERLEFLGDSVLSLYVTTRIFRDFSYLNEGDLSKFRSSIVNESSLAILAKFANISPFILLGKGELKETGYLKDSILSDTFEAVLGALYTAQGLDAVSTYLDLLYELAKNSAHNFFEDEILETFDAKSKLQELAMERFQTMPFYSFKNHGEQFEIELKIKNKTIKSLKHISKRKGMQELAKIVLEENLLQEI